MSEYIERDTVLDGLENINWYHTNPSGVLVYGSRSNMDSYIPYDEAEAMVNAIPAADVREVVRGKWIKYAPYNSDMMTCSECEKYWILDGDQYDFRFCPNCGASMGVTE